MRVFAAVQMAQPEVIGDYELGKTRAFRVGVARGVARVTERRVREHDFYD